MTLPPEHPRMRAWHLRERANTLWGLGRFQEAARAALESLAFEADSAHAFCILAQSQSGMGLTDEALASARRACALEPAQEWGHRLRAIYHHRRGESAEAVAAGREAARLAPDSAQALGCLSDALTAVGDLEEALRVALHICEVTPESMLAYERCGNIALERGQYAEAEGYFRRGLTLDPEHNVCLANLGWALQGQGRHREAIDCLAGMLGLHPDDPHADRVRQQLRYTVSTYLKGGDAEDLPAALREWYVAPETSY